MSTDNTTKRHARTRRGCLTCRIRKKKCDSLRPSCTKCTRLHVQCLGYASDRPEWLKGDSAKLYTTAIKCFLSEYPAAKAYSDPVPFLVLKATPEVERWLAQDPGAFNPVCFDSESSTLKPWSPSMVAQSLTEPHGAAFPAAATGGEPAHASSYPMPETATRSHEPLTPSPQTDYIYPPSSHYPVHPVAQGTATQATWMYTPQDMTQSFPATPYVPSQQPLYDYSSQGIAIHNYYNHDEHVVHHVGPTGLARQGYHALAPGKTGFDAAGAPVMWMF